MMGSLVSGTQRRTVVNRTIQSWAFSIEGEVQDAELSYIEEKGVGAIYRLAVGDESWIALRSDIELLDKPFVAGPWMLKYVPMDGVAFFYKGERIYLE